VIAQWLIGNLQLPYEFCLSTFDMHTNKLKKTLSPWTIPLSFANKKSLVLNFARTALATEAIFIVLLLASLAVTTLCGCMSQKSMDGQTLAGAGKTWAPGKISNVDLGRLKLTDKNGRLLDQSLVQKVLPGELNVIIDGQPAWGQSPATVQLNLNKKLAAKLRSKMDGTFLFLPWAKTTALVGGYCAIELPGQANKIFICGGDESPNRVRFAADKTWLVDLSSGEVQAGPDLNWPRKNPTLTLLKDGKILISGGNGGLASADDLSGAPALARLTPELEIYDARTNQISLAGKMQMPRDQTTAVVLGDGRVLIAGGDRPREAQQESVELQVEPLTAELYNPAQQKSVMLGPFKRLTAITWAAPLGEHQALLLGPHWGLQLGNEQLSDPAAEVVDATAQ